VTKIKCHLVRTCLVSSCGWSLDNWPALISPSLSKTQQTTIRQQQIQRKGG